MSGQRRFCTSCGTVRPTARYACALCGNPVRLHDVRPRQHTSQPSATSDRLGVVSPNGHAFPGDHATAAPVAA